MYKCVRQITTHPSPRVIKSVRRVYVPFTATGSNEQQEQTKQKKTRKATDSTSKSDKAFGNWDKN